MSSTLLLPEQAVSSAPNMDTIIMRIMTRRPEDEMRA
jgi:hypothetical protein